MSVFFNTLSRFVIVFLPRRECFLISWLQSPSTVILETKNIKSVTVSTFSPSIFHEEMGLDVMILISGMLSFMPTFSLSSFHLHQEALQFVFTFCHQSGTSAYLRLLIFFPAILIPACASSSPAFHTMYSAYKLNKQGDNIQP